MTKHELIKRRYNQLCLNRKAGLPVTVTLDDVLVAVFGVQE